MSRRIANPEEIEGRWVPIKKVCEIFGVSRESVRSGACGMDGIRIAMFGSELRAYWPDIVELHEQQLKQATKERDYVDDALDPDRKRRATGSE